MEKPPMEGWLCPALLKYYREAPKELYVKADPKVTWATRHDREAAWDRSNVKQTLPTARDHGQMAETEVRWQSPIKQ